MVAPSKSIHLGDPATRAFVGAGMCGQAAQVKGGKGSCDTLDKAVVVLCLFSVVGSDCGEMLNRDALKAPYSGSGHDISPILGRDASGLPCPHGDFLDADFAGKLNGGRPQLDHGRKGIG
jgi:hypothetical protein